MTGPNIRRIAVVAILAMTIARMLPGAPRAGGSLEHSAFVWQRDWSPAVQSAITRHKRNFASLVPLAAEVRFTPTGPEAFLVPLDWQSLQSLPHPLEIALRIGPYRDTGPTSHQRAGQFLAGLAASIQATAAGNGVLVSEIQLDFDCPESRLDDYRIWLQTIQSAVPRTRVTVTALPSWLDRSSCARLARAAGGYVLQVHSLSKPDDDDSPITLCDPAAARRAVETAGRIGVPFRVALPTYGYLTAFDANGKFLGLSAEGPDVRWPPFARTKRVMADPDELAALVRDWTRDRPACLRGLLWYRLPVDGDRLNWSWPTLAAVIRGQSPAARLETRLETPRPGLVEITLTNTGNRAATLASGVRIRWTDARLVAGDGWRGFQLIRNGADSAQLQPPADSIRSPLAPEQSVRIGWLRLDRPTDISATLVHAEKP